MAITKISPSVVDFDDGITITVDDNSDALTLTSTDADASIGPVSSRMDYKAHERR